MRKVGLASSSVFCSDFREDKKKGLHGPILSLLVRLCHQSDSFYGILFTFDSEHAKGLRFPATAIVARRSNDLYTGLLTVYLLMDESSNASVIRLPLANVLNFTIFESADTHH